MKDDKTDIIPQDQMLEILKKKAEMPESMKKALEEQEIADKLAEQIKTSMKNKYSDAAEFANKQEFMKKYADKLKAPEGMNLQEIPEETARLGMKVPPGMKKSALSKLASKAGKLIGPAAGLAGLFMQDELNPENPAENPNLSDEERMAYNIPRDSQEDYLNELEAQKKERYEKIKRRLAGEMDE